MGAGRAQFGPHALSSTLGTTPGAFTPKGRRTVCLSTAGPHRAAPLHQRARKDTPSRAELSRPR